MERSDPSSMNSSLLKKGRKKRKRKENIKNLLKSMQASFPARLSLHTKRLTLTSIMQPKQSSTFALLLKKLCVSQFKETQKAKPSVLAHSGNASRLTIRTTNEIYLRLIPTVSVPRISRSLIVTDVALKTMSALTAEIQYKRSTLTGRCVQVSK